MTFPKSSSLLPCLALEHCLYLCLCLFNCLWLYLCLCLFHWHPDHVLLRDGVKDMGDLAELDSQSIRPIHPNLLFQSGRWRWRWRWDSCDGWFWSFIELCWQSDQTYFSVCGAECYQYPLFGEETIQIGNSANTVGETVQIQLGNNTNRKQCRSGTAPIEESTIWRGMVLITRTHKTSFPRHLLHFCKNINLFRVARPLISTDN